MNATWTDALTIAVPIMAPIVALGAWGLTLLTAEMKRRNYNTALVRIASGAATAAGNVAIQLSQIPAGSDLAAVRRGLVASAEKAMQQTYAASIATANVTPAQVTSEVSGALGNNALHAVVVASLPAPAAAPPLGKLPPIPVSSTGTRS
jgi:hypothetical protein